VKDCPRISAEELAEIAESVRDVLDGLWGPPRFVGYPDAALALEDVWDAAADHGWLALGGDGMLEAALAVCAELGRAACPLPFPDVLAASLVLADPELSELIADGTVRPLAGEASAPGAFEFLDGGEAATHVLELPAAGEAVRLWRIVDVTPLPGLSEPAWSKVTGAEPQEFTVGRAAIDDARTLLRLALAVRASGAADRSHALALEHAGVRARIDRITGPFRMEHRRIADCAVDLTVSRLLALDAGARHDGGDAAWRFAAKIAIAHIRRTAPQVQRAAHRELADAGFFEDEETPWLFRRAQADLSRIDAYPSVVGEMADLLFEEEADLPALGSDDRTKADTAPSRAFTGDQRAVYVGRQTTVEQLWELSREIGRHRAGRDRAQNADGTRGADDATGNWGDAEIMWSGDGRTAGIERTFGGLLDVMRRHPELCGPRGSAVRAEAAGLAVRAQAARVLAAESARTTSPGPGGPIEALMAEITAGEFAEDLGEAALRILGARTAVAHGAARSGGVFLEHDLWFLVMAFTAGGGDVQRTRIAQRLGIPG